MVAVAGLTSLLADARSGGQLRQQPLDLRQVEARFLVGFQLTGGDLRFQGALQVADKARGRQPELLHDRITDPPGEQRPGRVRGAHAIDATRQGVQVSACFLSSLSSARARSGACRAVVR